LVSLSGYSRPYDGSSIMLNVGSTSFSGVMDKSSEMGINCALSVNRMHFDFSTNMVNANRSMNMDVANVGYIFPLNYLVSIVPVLGIGFSDGDHAGSYHCDIVHSINSTYYYNAGFICLIKLGKSIGFYTGIGTFESFRIGITYAFL
jgi:hypothetical protein